MVYGYIAGFTVGKKKTTSGLQRTGLDQGEQFPKVYTALENLLLMASLELVNGGYR